MTDIPISRTPNVGQPELAGYQRPEVESVRRPYTFAAEVVAGGSDVLLTETRMRENVRIVHVAVDFMDGAASDLQVYPIVAYADAATIVGINEQVPYSYVLEGPMHYLAGDAMTWRLDVAVPAAEGTFLGFRAVNLNGATPLTYRAAIVTEESYRVSA